MSIPVFLSTPDWRVSGVNSFVANLARGLNTLGADAKVIVTAALSEYECIAYPETPLVDLGLRRYHSPFHAWKRLSRFLIRNSPCVYIPGFDFYCGWMSATLPESIKVVGVLHSDEEVYYQFAGAVGHSHDRIVTVSHAIAEEVRQRWPELQSRLVPIWYGVDCPADLPPRDSPPGGSLKVLYAGRILHYQKRSLHIPAIAASAISHGASIELTVVGGGPDARLFDRIADPWVRRGILKRVPPQSNVRVLRMFEENDVFLLPSEFEGLPIALLEAMSRGCIPVVSDVRSGIPEVLRDGENGFRVPVNEIEGLGRRLAELQENPSRRAAMAAAAHRTIRDGGFSLDDSCGRWAALLQSLADGRDGSCAVQRHAKVALPRFIKRGMTDRWPGPIRRILHASYACMSKIRKR